MDIRKISNNKTKIALTSAAVILSGHVPALMQQAQAGTATIPVSVAIVSAVNLANTNALDFGRLAVTGAMTGSNHTISPAGVTTTAVGASVAIAGSPGDFDITAGSGAANVQVSYPASVTYNAGNIVMNRVTIGGVGVTASVQVAGGGTATANLAGGGNTAIDVGGRLNFTNTPVNGSYTGSSASIVITDLP